MQTLLLKIRDDKAFLLPEVSLSLISISLPEWIKKFYTTACWKISVLQYESNKRLLTAEILDYDYSDIDFSEAQFEYVSEHPITAINFPRIATEKLLAFTHAPYVSKSAVTDTLQANSIPATKIQYQYSIPIKKFRFGYGNVSTEIYVEELRKEIEIPIFNIEIRPEFDAIKNYFSNTLKTKKFDVDIELTLAGSEVIDKKATSVQVELINKQMIETIRFEFIDKSFFKKKIDIEHSVFTSEEMFQHFAEMNSSAFYDNENQLFDDILNIKNARHYRQLRYLSSLHTHEILKLRFVLKPFSFIFLIKGQSKFHIVWETLDTEEATYIWHTEKNIPALKQKLKDIDNIINTIKVQGKMVYLNDRPGDFSTVIHDYRSLTDGFIKWKADLDQRLI